MADHPSNRFVRRRPIEQSRSAIADQFAPEPGQIRIATAADIKFVDHVQRKFGAALGFLPRLALEKNLEAGHVKICCENTAEAGYILSRPRLAWQPRMRSIVQTAVLMDAQRRHHGLALLKQLELESLQTGVIAIQASCAAELESNEFWKAAGFMPIVHMTPDTKSGREIICWRKLLQGTPPIWFAMPPARTGSTSHAGTSTRDAIRTAANGDATGAHLTAHTG